MMDLNKISSLIITIFFVSILPAQFCDISVTIDTRQLKENDRIITADLGDQLNIFFESTLFDEEYWDIEIPLTIQLIFEGVSEKSGERIYSAQCLFSNNSDQRYFSKLLQFPYSLGQGVIYSPVIFEPLASSMEYYGYIILAGEADTYEIMGGNRFYERARELALRGMSSLYPRGWNNRVILVDNLSKNHGLRQAKFFYYKAGAMIEDEDYIEAEKAYNKMIENLEWVDTTFGRERYTLLFLEAHARDLANIPPQVTNRQEILSDLIILDPDNEDIYETAQVNIETQKKEK
ncbi:MAG: DUF4835 family protein [Candidatus Marinimicrobia bacterium]|nr:DUF4835 family protein [Candidatus Neomarinimicrobiota bacterium]MBL7046975.1 DUF4835 family protein [Candidatus Neomarinimicrobiota bacterium]